MRNDLGIAYGFTGLFGVALIIIAAGVEARGAGGARIALEVAARLEGVGGAPLRWVFLTGFWCTVFTAMLGVWQGVPQIYVDLASAWRTRTGRSSSSVASMDTRIQLGALAFLAGPPLVLLWHREPVGVVVAFSITGAFVMPFLAATLLYLNNRREWMGAMANRWPGNLALVVSLLVFGAVCVSEVGKALGR